MIAAIPFIVTAGATAGPVLADVPAVWLRRLSGWLWLIALVALADVSLANENAVWRMVGICSVLLGGMKGLVYAEWAGQKKLSISRYLIFAFLWFGMDPAAFATRRANLAWKIDVRRGFALMGIGTAAALLVHRMDWRQIVVIFLPLSLGFHFGALRVLKGVLRLAGFPVRTLFRNLLETRGIGDFWGKRWNVGYSQMLQRLVGRPVAAVAGKSAGVMAVFAASGLLHELAITLPVRNGFGGPTLYFLLHGLLVLAERKRGRDFGRWPALLAVALPLGLLFPPEFRDEVILRCYGLLDFVR